MSMISEQVKELRDGSDVYKVGGFPEVSKLLKNAADTIESLSAKQENAYYVKRNGKDDVIVSIMYNKADNKYHFVNLSKNHICACGFETTEEAIADMEQRKNNGSICDFYLIERSAEDCVGGWIYCGDGNNLPEIERDIILSTRSLDVYKGYRANTEGYFYAEGEGYILYENVLAWMQQPEPYHEP